jgi:S-adenosylmethionine:tRNA ribosyltransferase-isomerase
LSVGRLTSDYDYDLPPDRIAQSPAEPRDSSRLMLVDRQTATITHHVFSDLATLIPPGDLLVVNTTQVMRARLLGTRDSGAPGEVFLLRRLDTDRYEALVSPGGKLRPGRTLHIAAGFDVEILEMTPRRTRIVRLLTADPDAAIEQFGHVPLPPYIERPDAPTDAARYQTVYARQLGSVAAPTAGLHFTPLLLDTLTSRGVSRAELLLHVGAGTFKPVEVDDPADHVMHEEWYSISPEAAHAITTARGKIWSVGTTTTRTLESAAAEDGVVKPGSGETKLFIRPPYTFKVVDRLITNFHLPKSTLLMLVAAFAGYDLTMRAYREAVTTGYRFYSYGDAMAIV